MDSAPDHNPSPPPEILQQPEDFVPDRIGDSMFSKKWIIQVLVNIIESVNKSESAAISEDIQEIDKELETDTSALWDISTNEDVAAFLHEFNVADLVVEVVAKSKSPRLVEIAVGILGNMASFEEICDELTENEDLFNTIVPLMGSSDVPTVIQVLRLIRTCVINENSDEKWKTALRDDITFMNYLRFILQNSLNGEALKGALQLLYYLLDNSVSSCKIWTEASYMKSLESAGKQLMFSKDEAALSELWLLLNLLTQDEGCAVTVGSQCDSLTDIFISYIFLLFGEQKRNVLPKVERTTSVVAGFTTFTVLAKENKQCFEKLQAHVFLRIVNRMQEAIREKLIKEHDNIVAENTTNKDSSNPEHSVSENNTQHSPKISKYDINSLIMLQEALVNFCKLFTFSLTNGDTAQ